MIYRVLADATVVLHLGFVLFVLLGGVLAARRAVVAWAHLAAVAWAAWVEFSGSMCPLTPLENWLRVRGGGGGVYATSFVEQYILPLLYPAALTRDTQFLLGGIVLGVNALAYALIIRRRRARA